MGTVIDLNSRRRKPATGAAERYVTCAHCSERHPIIRFAGGEIRCVTAFGDGERYFCRNRGCRAAWLSRRGRRE